MVLAQRETHEAGVTNHVGKLRTTLVELRRQTDATMTGLHSIRMRTSRVLAATEAFAALSQDVASLGRELWSPLTCDRLNRDATERAQFLQQLHLLVDQLDSFRQRYATELSQSIPPKPARKKSWWHVFK